MRLRRCLVAAGVALAASVWLAHGGADTKPQPSRGVLPADLNLVPRDAAGFLSIRVADLWNRPRFKDARSALLREAPEIHTELTKALGVPPEQVERLTMIVTELGPRTQPVAVVATNKDYDRKSVMALLGPGSTEETYLRHTLHVSKNGRQALHLYDEHTYVFGDVPSVKELLGFPRDKSAGPLSEALRLAAHPVVLGVNGVAVSRAINRELASKQVELSAAEKAFLPLLKAQKATAVLDLGKELAVDVRVHFENNRDAQKGAKVVEAARQLAGLGLTQVIAQSERKKEMKGTVSLLKLLDRALKAGKLAHEHSTVTFVTRAPFEPKQLVLSLVESVQRARAAAERARSQNNLRQIGLAMHNYAMSNDYHLPPSAILDKNGKPLLSWRVLILPYIEQDALYKRFHLDEPWDSAHNKKLLAMMPPVYAGDPMSLKNHETYYQCFHGRGAAFEGKKGVPFPASFTDGTSNTILVVEAAKAVPWTKPDDIPFDDSKEPGKELLQKVGGLVPNGFNATYCDGSVRFIPKTIKPSVLRLLILRNDGMPLPADAP